MHNTGAYQQILLQALYLPCDGRDVRIVKVPTLLSNSGDRYPVVDFFFQQGTTTIHKYAISLSLSHHFIIYYRVDANSSLNRALLSLNGTIDWRGDLIVIRVGVNGSMVNINKGEDRDAAIEALLKFLQIYFSANADTSYIGRLSAFLLNATICEICDAIADIIAFLLRTIYAVFDFRFFVCAIFFWITFYFVRSWSIGR